MNNYQRAQITRRNNRRIMLLIVALLFVAMILWVTAGKTESAPPLPPGSAQFIDRIVRGCDTGAVTQASVIVNPLGAGTVDVTPCTGGGLTVNGVAVASTGAQTFTGTQTFSGRIISTVNGASLAPPVSLVGTIFTGGGTTNTKPAFLVEPTGTVSTGWNNAGTLIGGNAPSGFTGNLIDLQLNGVNKFRVDPNGFTSTSVTGGFIVPTVSALYPGSATIGVTVSSARAIAWATTTDPTSGTYDTTLSRNGAGIVQVGTTTTNSAGTIKAAAYLTDTNCADSAGAAACGSAAAGAFVVDAAATTVVVSTTAVTANSEIILQYDSSLGARLAITCNVTPALPAVTARTAGTSFTVTLPAAPAVNPACFTYYIVN